MRSIRYKAGYKYQLMEDYLVEISLRPAQSIKTKWLELTMSGMLTVKDGYAWDGPSGPTFDTRDFMRGSLVHDALYQLMRLEILPLSRRKEADKELMRICREDGMNPFRALYIYDAVRGFGESAGYPANEREILEAP